MNWEIAEVAILLIVQNGSWQHLADGGVEFLLLVFSLDFPLSSLKNDNIFRIVGLRDENFELHVQIKVRDGQVYCSNALVFVVVPKNEFFPNLIQLWDEDPN